MNALTIYSQDPYSDPIKWRMGITAGGKLRWNGTTAGQLDSWNRQLPTRSFTVKIVAERPLSLDAPDGSLKVAAQPARSSLGCYGFEIERLTDRSGTMARKSILTVRR